MTSLLKTQILFLIEEETPLFRFFRRERNQGEDQRIRTPFQNDVLEEEPEFIEDEGEAEDNIQCMEDEVDYSFLT